MEAIQAAPSGVGLVIGGADCVYEEFIAARAMCHEVGISYQTFVVNDMIPVFEGYIDHAVTLHPQKLTRDDPKWLVGRARRGFLPPGEVWAHRNGNCADAVTRDCADHSQDPSWLF